MIVSVRFGPNKYTAGYIDVSDDSLASLITHRITLETPFTCLNCTPRGVL